MIFELLKQRGRRRLRARPFPKEWLTLIQRHVVFFHKLSATDRAELLGHIQVFLAEKRFEGCGAQIRLQKSCSRWGAGIGNARTAVGRERSYEKRVCVAARCR